MAHEEREYRVRARGVERTDAVERLERAIEEAGAVVAASADAVAAGRKGRERGEHRRGSEKGKHRGDKGAGNFEAKIEALEARIEKAEAAIASLKNNHIS